MTEQEKQEIITEVKKSVMDEMKDKIVKEDTQKTLKIPREKWYGERFSHGRESAMVQAFDTPYMAWEICIKKQFGNIYFGRRTGLWGRG